MSLTWLLLVLLIVGVVFAFFPIDAMIKKIIIVVLVVILILFLFSLLRGPIVVW